MIVVGDSSRAERTSVQVAFEPSIRPATDLISAIKGDDFVPVVAVCAYGTLPRYVSVGVFVERSRVREVLRFERQVSSGDAIDVVCVAVVICVFVRSVAWLQFLIILRGLLSIHVCAIRVYLNAVSASNFRPVVETSNFAFAVSHVVLGIFCPFRVDGLVFRA